MACGTHAVGLIGWFLPLAASQKNQTRALFADVLFFFGGETFSSQLMMMMMMMMKMKKEDDNWDAAAIWAPATFCSEGSSPANPRGVPVLTPLRGPQTGHLWPSGSTAPWRGTQRNRQRVHCGTTSSGAPGMPLDGFLRLAIHLWLVVSTCFKHKFSFYSTPVHLPMTWNGM